MKLRVPTSDGDQLDLFPEELRALSRVPWEGRSPRSLTRGAVDFIFKPSGKKSMSDLLSPAQLEFWRRIEVPRGELPGAPLLLGLPKRRY